MYSNISAVLYTFWGGTLSSLGLGSVTDLASVAPLSTSNHSFLSPIPVGFDHLSVSYVKDNLAVFPGEWENAGIKSPFYDCETDDAGFREALSEMKNSDFIAWDDSFFGILGRDASLERIQSFVGEPAHVHEAPAYVPEMNELVFSDTSVTGWLWAVNIDTHKVRKLYTNPPLKNINGARYHNGKIYVATNGGSVRGIWSLDLDGAAQPVVNNFRGRHLNSPNDLIFDSASNIWFTDPPYGWCQQFPDVQPPELAAGVYFFNTTSKALITSSNTVVMVPNGLALSNNGSVLYVADSNATSGRPMSHEPSSLRNIWAFDVHESILGNPRLVYQTESGWPDGLQVTRNGYLMIAALGGVDIVDPTTGVLLGKVNAPDDIIFNLERGQRSDTHAVWLLTGQNYIYKLSIREG